jgi:Ser/Thr protein kinase RdoA (MazF antagonist)
MMKLSAMRALIMMLDENDESPVANVIASRWNHDPGTVRFFRASANFLFLFKHSEQDYVLRFINQNERAFDAIHAELAYLAHLASHGVHVAKPILSRAENLVETIETELGMFHAVVFERLMGEQFELPDLTPDRVMRWGQALGGLHNAAQGYDGAGRATWQDQLEWVAATLPEEERTAKALLAQIKDQLSQLPIHNANFGLIHFDFELDNLIWQDHQVGVVDFDDSASYWFAADVAFALRDVFDDNVEKINLEHEIARQFIKGYRMVRSVDTEELAYLPLFLQLHHLVMFVKLLQSLKPDEHPEEPVWAEKLREKLHNKMVYYRDEFANSLQ